MPGPPKPEPDLADLSMYVFVDRWNTQARAINAVVPGENLTPRVVEGVGLIAWLGNTREGER